MSKNLNKVYKVRLVNPDIDLDTVIKVKADEYILDAAEQQGLNLPVSCRAGACISCTAKLVQGQVDQDHNFLKPLELQAGFVLTCKSYVTSDCTFITHQEDALLDM